MSTKSVSAKIRRIALAAVVLIFLTLSIFAFLPDIFKNDPAVSEYPVPENSVAVTEKVSDSNIPDAAVVPEPSVPDEATLMFGGDILIHKRAFVNAQTGDSTYDFTPYFELFTDAFSADYNSINLECPVDAYGDNREISTYPRFNAPIELLDGIKSMNIQLCTNSNNHMIDQDYDGMVRTHENVMKYGFDTLGTYTSQEEHDALFIRDINGIKIGFVAYSQRTNGLKLSKEQEAYAFDRLGDDTDELENILLQVSAMRDAGAEIVVAVLHWGEEYNDYPGYAQRCIAQKLCENGVDIIIGSHPHVVQPVEIINVSEESGRAKNCLVVYSLGNLFCDQHSYEETTKTGMIVGIRLLRDETGTAYLADEFYMPTITYITREKAMDYIRLAPAGRYMNSTELPYPVDDDNFKYKCTRAWDHVTKIAGDSVAAVTDPDHYPDWMIN